MRFRTFGLVLLQGQSLDQIVAQWGPPSYKEYFHYRWGKCMPYSATDHYINGMYQGTSRAQMCSTTNVYFNPETRIIKSLTQNISIY